MTLLLDVGRALQSSEGLGLRDQLPRWLTEVACKVGASPWGFLGVLTARQPISPGASDTTDHGGSCSAFYGLSLEVTHGCCCRIDWSQRLAGAQCGEDLHQGVHTGRWNHLGLSGRMVTTEGFFL